MGSDDLNEMKDAGVQEASAEDTAAVLPESVMTEKPRKKRPKKGLIITVAILLVLALLFLLPGLLGSRKNTLNTKAYSTYTVKRGDITETISGSGTLQPADSYTVTSLISGDILTAPFEEGDVVAKDQTLYTLDSSDIANSIKQAENTLRESQNKYNSALKQLDNLNLKVDGAGSVVTLDVHQGDTVQAGQTVALIRDASVMRVKVLFQRDTAAGFYIGETAYVTNGGTFESYTGVITGISGVDTVLPGNIIAREVTVEVSNPGAFTASTSVFVSVSGNAGLQNGTLSYKYEGTVTAVASGTVSQINIQEGSRVSKGQVIAVLQNDTVDQQVQTAQSALENAKLALESQNNKLSGYTIQSPIAGTIVEKDYKEGDTMKAGEVLCTVFDLSHLSLTLNIDELDIRKVQPGQAVTITADAAKGTEYNGTVTKVNIKGTTKNGVTSYPVTIQIDKMDELLPGMNVDAKIIVQSLKNVITVPVGAVLNNNLVLLKTDEKNTGPAQADIPAGFIRVEVTLGASSDTDIVITGGLKEGDVIAVMDNTPSAYNYDPFQRTENRTDNSSGGMSDGGGAGPDESASQTAAGVSG